MSPVFLGLRCIMCILAFEEDAYFNNLQPYEDKEEEQVTEEQTKVMGKEEQTEEEEMGCKLKRC